jgi:hypothetical protein
VWILVSFAFLLLLLLLQAACALFSAADLFIPALSAALFLALLLQMLPVL